MAEVSFFGVFDGCQAKVGQEIGQIFLRYGHLSFSLNQSPVPESRSSDAGHGGSFSWVWLAGDHCILSDGGWYGDGIGDLRGMYLCRAFANDLSQWAENVCVSHC